VFNGVVALDITSFVADDGAFVGDDGLLGPTAVVDRFRNIGGKPWRMLSKSACSRYSGSVATIGTDNGGVG
jgi:hypothetical protein